MRRSPTASISELRTAIDCMPRRTREAMLRGIQSGPIIVGAYSDPDGICPMLAAHRHGGRTDFIGFARAWDRFASRATPMRRARRATERELLILRTHLEASLLEEDAGAVDLAAAVREHRALVSNRPADQPQARAARRRGVRPGDPDRSRELRRRDGWAWTRVFRRLDDYERALARLEAAHGDVAAADAPERDRTLAAR